jgi:putative flippase GtrA
MFLRQTPVAKLSEPAKLTINVFSTQLGRDRPLNVADTYSPRGYMMTAGPSRQFVAFMLVGGIAALVNLVARILFSYVVIYEIAIVLAFVAAMTCAFVLNRRYVFVNASDNASDNASRQYTRLAIVNLLALVQVWLISVGLVRLAIGFIWQAETMAHAIGVVSPVITSYFAHKYYSFRE